MEIHIFDKSLEEFIESLEKSTIAKVLRNIDLLEKFGPKLGLPHSKKILTRLFELRIRGKQEVRIFYTFNKLHIILLHGFIKKSGRIPKKEIQTALQRLKRLDKI
jgi:phage-related protein